MAITEDETDFWGCPDIEVLDVRRKAEEASWAALPRGSQSYKGLDEKW